MSAAAVDVHYGDEKAVAACLLFDDWASARTLEEHVLELGSAAPYVRGEFFRRELPCLLGVLGELCTSPQMVIVDGFVWLDRGQTPGLGAHLWKALEERGAVIGVAKSPLRGLSPEALAITRGRSRRPLYISAAGMPVAVAAEWIRGMHGKTRIPTLLGRVDRLARGLEGAGGVDRPRATGRRQKIGRAIPSGSGPDQRIP
jgi:deoxyribonuclease V